MNSVRKIQRRIGELEDLAEDLKELTESVVDASDADNEPDSDESEQWDPSELTQEIKGEVNRLTAPIAHIQRTQVEHADNILGKLAALERKIGVTATRIETQDVGALIRGADALKKAAADLLKVPDVGVSSVFVVKHRASGVGQLIGIFPATCLEEARALASRPDLVVCAAVFHGSIKIGDVIP